MSAGWAAFGSVEGGETRERGCPKSREDAPEHKSASDFPLPVGDSNSAFSPLSNAFRTFPMTPCAMRRRGETRRRRGGDEGRGRRERRDGGATRRGCIESSTSSSSRGRRTSCDAYGLNGNRTSYPPMIICTSVVGVLDGAAPAPAPAPDGAGEEGLDAIAEHSLLRSRKLRVPVFARRSKSPHRPHRTLVMLLRAFPLRSFDVTTHREVRTGTQPPIRHTQHARPSRVTVPAFPLEEPLIRKVGQKRSLS